MSYYFHPFTWLRLADELPRTAAIVVLVLALSMLIFGLRAFRYYATAALAAGAYAGGLTVGRLMYVNPLYVAIPFAVVAAILGFFLAMRLLPLFSGALFAGIAGVVVTHLLAAPKYFWVAVAAGALVGCLLGLFAKRLTTAVVCSAVGTGLCIATLGTVVQAPEGPFMAKGYLTYSTAFLVVGGVLFVIGVILQTAIGSAAGARRYSAEGARL